LNCLLPSQRRPSYYGDLFIAKNHDVDSHLKAVYAKKSKSKVLENAFSVPNFKIKT